MCVCVCVCVRVCVGMDDNWCLYTRIIIAQVKASAKKMVTVVATRELKAEDVLIQFQAEAATHKHGSRSISARSCFGNGC